MRIAIILPGEYGRDACEKRRGYFLDFADKTTDLTVVSTGGTESLRCGADFAFLAPRAISLSMTFEKGGYDGILLHGMCDFGSEYIRSVVRIPVVGAGGATFHLACQLADAIGVISANSFTVKEVKRRTEVMGFSKPIVAWEALDVPVKEIEGRKEEVEMLFTQIAQRQISDKGAQVIITGSGGILPSLGKGSRERLEDKLQVPVLDGCVIGLKTLEMMVQLGLSHSRTAYPLSPGWTLPAGAEVPLTQ